MVVGSNPTFEHSLKWHVQSSSVGRARTKTHPEFLHGVSVRSGESQRRGLGWRKAFDPAHYARMVELVDTLDLGSSASRFESSSLSSGTTDI